METSVATPPSMGFDVAEFLVSAAVRAPSVHNTQPWRFVHRLDQGIELWADHRRALPVTDPAGREMAISCGAALATLALGIRWLGYWPRIRRRPDPAEPGLLAIIGLGQARPANPLEIGMFTAVLDRHTHRGAFEDLTLPPAVFTRLPRVARRSGCHAVFIRDKRALRQVAQLTAEAQRVQNRQAAVRDELTRWLRQANAPRRDGVEPPAEHSAGPGRLALRWSEPVAEKTADTTPTPTTILLATDRDNVLSWLRSGEALQYMLLYSAEHEIQASIHTQALEVRTTRARLGALAGGRHAQMLLQLGRTHSPARAARRPPLQVLRPA